MTKINFKRVIIAGLVIDILSFVIPLISYNLFSWVFELEPTNIWKWTPQMSLTSMPSAWVIAANTVLAIFVAFLYALLYKAIPGSGIKKGLMFGVLMYPMTVLIPMFSAYVLLNIAAGAVLYLTLEGLVEFLVYGIVAAAIYKEKGFVAGE